MSAALVPFTAERLAALVDDARNFAAELARYAACEAADAELDTGRRLDLRRRIIDMGFVWKRDDWSAAEVDCLYALAREAARIALARRTTKFRATYGIVLSCGEPPSHIEIA